MHLGILRVFSAITLLVLLGSAPQEVPQEVVKPKPVQENTANPPIHLNAKYKVVVDFYFDHESMKKYPKTAEALKKAIQAWEKVIPIAPRIFDSKANPINIPGVIKVKIVAAQHSWNPNLLGWWNHTDGTLYLVGSFLEHNEKQAIVTAAHRAGRHIRFVTLRGIGRSETVPLTPAEILPSRR